jgi:hypothetical protein
MTSGVTEARRALFAIAIALITWPAHAGGTLTCHVWQGIRYCEGPNGYRTEEHDYGGNTYTQDNKGNAWVTHEWGGNTYTTQTRKGRP